jgi:hypothetical protein
MREIALLKLRWMLRTMAAVACLCSACLALFGREVPMHHEGAMRQSPLGSLAYA